jgi:hypothetical protein
MKVEIVEQYLDDRYGNSSLKKNQDGYKLDDLFIYVNENKELRWYVNVESDLYSWFG